MLGLVGLLGALMAGVVADSMMSMGNSTDHDDDDAPPDDATPEVIEIFGTASESTLSPDDPDYRPVSDDTPPTPDADQNLVADADGSALSGGGGQDTLTGGAGPDQLTGRGGNDAVAAGGADSVQAGAGDDTLWGGDGDDWLAGGWNDDALTGGAGADTLDGGQGNDTLLGADAQVDFLNGGDGHDVLALGAGDYGSGQAGADQFALADYGAGAEPARIADYDGAEDEIVVMYDPLVHPDPAVTTQAVEGSDDVSVLLDGIAVAVVQGGVGLTAGDIRLMAA